MDEPVILREEGDPEQRKKQKKCWQNKGLI